MTEATTTLTRAGTVTDHGIAHDAAGYLLNYHGTRPGYQYVPGVSGLLSRTSPLAGQVAGLNFFGNLRLYGTPHAPPRDDFGQ
jgi:hypothetical protein